MIFVLDNYDSFTYNLVHMIYSFERDVTVMRNREVTPEDVLAMEPEAIVLSPGPGRPDKAGCLEELIRLAAGKIPMLGVCLGHQAIGEVFGSKVVHASSVMHGKTSNISHDGKGLFRDMRDNFKAVRYHSLVIEKTTLAPDLEITALSDDGEIMGVRHKKYPIEGIQYHPESIMTPSGARQIANFIDFARKYNTEAVSNA